MSRLVCVCVCVALLWAGGAGVNQPWNAVRAEQGEEWLCWIAGADGVVVAKSSVFIGDSSSSSYARGFERWYQESHGGRGRGYCASERHPMWSGMQGLSVFDTGWRPSNATVAGVETGEWIPTGNACRFDGGRLPDRISISLRSNNEARRIVERIVSSQALPPNFRVVSSTHPDVRNNAIATIDRDGKRIIAYDPNFMNEIERETGTSWAAISIFAHEVGHHLSGHTLDAQGSRPPTELEADRFSGFIMKVLGASLLDAQAAMRAIASDRGSATHPAKRDRLNAIERGWQQGTPSGGGVPPYPTPGGGGVPPYPTPGGGGVPPYPTPGMPRLSGICGTQFGSCQAQPRPAGSPCYCVNPYTGFWAIGQYQ